MTQGNSGGSEFGFHLTSTPFCSVITRRSQGISIELKVIVPCLHVAGCKWTERVGLVHLSGVVL